ncbi:MAG TPA: hypothetical protein PKX48_14530 [Planctomycetota bacterium]|jgi:hypothetical protein|nr:hypothetical protein [Planctomycetota bacterium]OQC19317.1 MAG: hypothetical protein BWX69_02815 [Planctomycetes bacterium ADurb.Bin069]NMD35122.1 hypothetical protein [Planctomycetota bacterium]HNS00423.1 hypothetical protein [Planctomycetota bacterium]HNU26972.1 hypothetical protein [Planctomycetota bacterium]
MTLGGWIFMLGSIGFVLSLCAFCFWRVFRRPGTAERLQSPHTIATRDKDT